MFVRMTMAMTKAMAQMTTTTTMVVMMMMMLMHRFSAFVSFPTVYTFTGPTRHSCKIRDVSWFVRHHRNIIRNKIVWQCKLFIWWRHMFKYIHVYGPWVQPTTTLTIENIGVEIFQGVKRYLPKWCTSHSCTTSIHRPNLRLISLLFRIYVSYRNETRSPVKWCKFLVT